MKPFNCRPNLSARKWLFRILSTKGRGIYENGSYMCTEADPGKGWFVYDVDGNYGDYITKVQFAERRREQFLRLSLSGEGVASTPSRFCSTFSSAWKASGMKKDKKKSLGRRRDLRRPTTAIRILRPKKFGNRPSKTGKSAPDTRSSRYPWERCTKANTSWKRPRERNTRSLSTIRRPVPGIVPARITTPAGWTSAST